MIQILVRIAFRRIRRKKKHFDFVLMAGMMVPGFATLISTYLMMSQFNLINTLWAIILPAAINPLHIFLMRQFMMTIPKSYDESAEIDGCVRLKILFLIILPMSKPVLMLCVLQSFIGSWNNFIGPLIYLNDYHMMTLPIGLRLLHGYMGTGNVAVILAGISMSFLVPVVLYAFGQRYLIEGIALSGLKS